MSNHRYYLATVVAEALAHLVGASVMQGVTMQDQRTGQAWMAVIAECKRTYPWICHLCGRAIPTVHRNHELAYQVDHILPVSTHPHLTRALANCRPSHRQCNRYRSDRPLTPGLIAEITAKFAGSTVRPALAFFDA